MFSWNIWLKQNATGFEQRVRWLRGAVMVAAVLLFPNAAVAENRDVVCGGIGPYPTITAALNSLPVNSTTEPHTIKVTGTCNENVDLYSRNRITIEQAEGVPTAAIVGADPDKNVLSIKRSRGITLRRLVISGGSGGVMIEDSSEVDMYLCTVEYTGGVGIRVSDLSNLRLDRATIRNNGGTGFVVDDDSYAGVGESHVDQLIWIHDNDGPGISVTSSVMVVRGKTIIENNTGAGISLSGSRFQQGDETAVRNNGRHGLYMSNDSSAAFSGLTIIENNGSTGVSLSGSQFRLVGTRGENLILNNGGFGVDITSGSSAMFNGRNTIRGNLRIGVQVGRGSSASFETARMTDGSGSFGYTTIENHSQLGVNIAGGGNAGFFGNHKIRGNGFEPDSPELPPHRGGFRVATQGGLVLRGGPEVSNNTGPGIWIEVGASVGLGYPAEPVGAIITGNTKEGVLVTRNANLWIASPSTVADNGSANISCDRSAWVFGDITSIKGVKCENVLPDGKK